MVNEAIKEQFKAERKYFLGYSDKVPGTGQKVSDARKEYQELNDAAEADQQKARDEFNASVELTNDQSVRTTVVGNSVVDLQLSPNAAAPVEAPTDPLTELMKESKGDLVRRAEEAGISVVPDSMTKADIAALILAKV